MKPTAFRTTAAACLVWAGPHFLCFGRFDDGMAADESASGNQVLEWNQIFIDTLIATNTPNSSSQRLGSDRAHGDLRCPERNRAAVHANLHSQSSSS